MRIPGPVLRHRRSCPGRRGAVPVRQVLHRPVRFHIVLVRHNRPVAHVHVLEIRIVLQRHGLLHGRRGYLQHHRCQLTVRRRMYAGLHTEGRTAADAQLAMISGDDEIGGYMTDDMAEGLNIYWGG